MPENEMMETGADGIAGKLQVRLVEEGTRRPVAGADIQITYEGSPDSPVKSTVTDESGMTEIMELPAPDPSYSENYSEQQPYSEYTVRVRAPGYEDVEVAGTEVQSQTRRILPWQSCSPYVQSLPSVPALRTS